VVSLCLVSPACDDGDSRPPSASEAAGDFDPVVACSTLLTDGFDTAGDFILVDDAEAGCAGESQFCPLEQSDTLRSDADCEADEEAHAVCEANQWRLRCVTPPELDTGAGGGSGGIGGAAGTSGTAGASTDSAGAAGAPS
jgi:hypothetical protein